MPRRPGAEFEITAKDRAQSVLRSVDRSLSNLTRTAATGVRSLGALGGVLGTASIAELADRYNQLTVRVRTATRDTGDFAEVLAALRDTAIGTGTDLETAVDTFQALSRVREDIGATNEQMLVLTRTVQQLGIIGGTSQEALANGLRQFNQAIAGGVFRAEEFNSIVENTPELAKRLADGFGVTQGELRKMVIEGRLFADDVINTLLKQAPEISEQFAEIPINLDRAFGALGTSIAAAASALDQSTGFTQGLAGAIDQLALSIRLATGVATDFDKVQDRIRETENELEIQTQRLTELFRIGADNGIAGWIAELAGVASPTEQAQAKIRELAEQLAELRRQVASRDDVGQIEGSGRSTGPDPEVIAKAQRELDKAFADEAKYLQRHRQIEAQAVEHFQNLMQIEADYLKTQGELALEGRVHFANLIDQELEQMRADELARALGFEDEKALMLFEREELLHQAHLEELYRRLEDELAQELGFEDRRTQELADAESRRQDALLRAKFKGNDIAQRAIGQLKKFEEAQGAQKVAVLLGQAAELTQGMAGESEKAFRLNKAARIGETLINTAAGIARAFADLPFPVAIGAAAAIAAVGIAQIGAIQSAQFGGGGGGGSFGGGGSLGGGAADTSALREIPVFTTEGRSASTIELRLTGEGALATALIEGMQVEVAEGDAILITDRSRQAIEIERRL